MTATFTRDDFDHILAALIVRQGELLPGCDARARYQRAEQAVADTVTTGTPLTTPTLTTIYDLMTYWSSAAEDAESREIYRRIGGIAGDIIFERIEAGVDAELSGEDA